MGSYIYKVQEMINVIQAIKHFISKKLNENVNYKWFNAWLGVYKKHRSNEKRHIVNTEDDIYYIIQYDDPQYSGWTVYERLVLFSCLYAIEHHMIPVVDMKSKRNIYQRSDEFQRVNIWDRFYFQPAGVSLEAAMDAGNYIISDPSNEWLQYICRRRPKRFTNEYLRLQYAKYIRLKPEMLELCEKKMKDLIPESKIDKRLFGIVVRGTDYVKYNHPVQPEIREIVELAKEKYKEFQCEYYFISTEDHDILQKLKSLLPENKIITYNAGNIKKEDLNGFVGKYLRKTKGGYGAAIDYQVTLYILDKCCCLVGGICGATMVAKYRKNPPYEYINIIDMHRSY